MTEPNLPGQSVTVAAHEVIVYTVVLNTVLVVSSSSVVAAGFETGKTVVAMAMLDVDTLAGQSVTEGAQEVTVTTVVEYKVLVVKVSAISLETRVVVVSMGLVTGKRVMVEAGVVTGTTVVETG